MAELNINFDNLSILDKIILDIGNKILTICGFELGIYDYCNKNIVIDGMITSVMFE